MSIAAKHIEQLLGVTGWSFENARDRSEINLKVIDYGYDTARLEALLDLNGRLDGKYFEQQTLRGKQTIATNKFQRYFDAQKKSFQNTRKLVLKVIKGEKIQEYLELLGLNVPMKGSLTGFTNQARQFYANTRDTPEIIDKLAKFNLTPEKVQALLDALPQLAELNKTQETAKALAQAARRDRDILYKELRQEWTDFKDVCDMAFEDEEKDNPQYKELVGIMEPSEGYKRKTKATEPGVPADANPEPGVPADNNQTPGTPG